MYFVNYEHNYKVRRGNNWKIGYIRDTSSEMSIWYCWPPKNVDGIDQGDQHRVMGADFENVAYTKNTS